jgi:ribonuclease Z
MAGVPRSFAGLDPPAYNRPVKSTFQAQLVNPPFGDPGLYVRLRWQGRALLFDLGRLDRLDNASLLRLDHVFVSHAHMDHFIGFDHLLRVFLAREARLRIFGPPGIIANVIGKISGYTWNLVDGYPLVLEVVEVAAERLRRVVLRAASRFAVEPAGDAPCGGSPLLRLAEEPGLVVDAIHLDHKIPCLAFAAWEPTHLNIDTGALARLALSPGPWLNRLKAAIRAGEPPATLIAVSAGLTLPLGMLRAELVTETAGQRIVYVTDARFSDGNIARILQLARGADLFVCEAPFLDVHRERAAARAHLTARQAGALARWAGARDLKLFHFSPRHEGAEDDLRQEAEDEFTGREVHYGDGPECRAAELS